MDRAKTDVVSNLQTGVILLEKIQLKNKVENTNRHQEEKANDRRDKFIAIFSQIWIAIGWLKLMRYFLNVIFFSIRQMSISEIVFGLKLTGYGITSMNWLNCMFWLFFVNLLIV